MDERWVVVGGKEEHSARCAQTRGRVYLALPLVGVSDLHDDRELWRDQLQQKRALEQLFASYQVATNLVAITTVEIGIRKVVRILGFDKN